MGFYEDMNHMYSGKIIFVSICIPFFSVCSLFLHFQFKSLRSASVITTLEKILGYRSWRLTQALGDKTQMRSQKEPFIQMYSLIKCPILITEVQQGNILSGHKKKKHLHFYNHWTFKKI